MNCIYKPAKTAEKRFSQREAVILSEFSRRQLQKLEELGILIPQKTSVLSYNWNQTIFMRILYCLRQVWSLQDIIKAFKNPENPIDIEVIVDNIDKFDDIYLGQKIGVEIPVIYFQVSPSGYLSQSEQKAINKLRDEMSPIVIGNGIAVGQGKFISIDVPKVIKDLKIKINAEKLGSE